jgi:hypothetical protein
MLQGKRQELLPALILTPITLVYWAFKVVALLSMVGHPLNAVLLLVICFAAIG